MPAQLKEGTAELTHGISDEHRHELTALASDPSKLFAALNHTPEASRITIDGVHVPVYVAGFMLLHYFAKKVAATR